MLPPFIIEQIRKREEDEKETVQQPVIELPLPPPDSRVKPPADDEQRGVIVIDLMG